MVAELRRAEYIRPANENTGGGALAISVTSRLEEVEPAWRLLEAGGIESPGQSFDFTRSWVRCHEVPADRQVYVTAHAGGRAVALLALRVERRFGASVLGFIPGEHVGCNAPLLDTAWYARQGAEARRALWTSMLAALPQVDAVVLRAVPDKVMGEFALFEAMGTRSGCETLFRSEFASWTECDETMRNRKHRKRDRQQGQRLDALGEISYGTAQREQFDEVLGAMFRQKAERFAVLGIEDPFADARTRAAYRDVLDTAATLKPEVFVLRVNGEIVAVRYALGHGTRLFALISSMSEDPAMQTGSPGRQEIYRTVQSIFGRGYRVLDLGAAESDEKRAWCNRRVQVFNHYFPRTLRGRGFALAERALNRLRVKIKSDPRLFGAYKRLRGVLPGALRA